MHFKRIEMHGFKSFAEPVVVEFDRGITCVVGPNGSGKSNISDAIRWVLGEQSPKLLRGGKMEDVIFSGTASRKSRGMAEVTLVIDNADGKLPIEYGEVAISRRMYRSGESEYAINNNPCRMRDIRDLLADTGIGVDGYSLIGQGKISEIISNKKESIREIFEETAGIVSYRNKKNEAVRKLETTGANMERITDIIMEIEERIDSLREESEKAKIFLSLKDRYKELEVSIITDNLKDIEEKLQILSEDSNLLKRDIEKTDESIKKGEENNKKLKADIATAAGDLESVVAEINTLNENIALKGNENSLSRERLKAIENNRLRIRREIKSIGENLENERKKLSCLKLEEEEFQKLMQSENELLKEGEKKLSQKRKALEKLQTELGDCENRFFSIASEISALMSREEGLLNLMENLNASADDWKTDIHEEEYGKCRADIESLTDKKIALNGKIGDGEKEIIHLKKNLNELEKELYNLKNNVYQNRIDFDKKREKMKMLAEMEDDYEGYQYPVKFLMKKNIAGILDVVANIVKVRSGMELAMETAMGASMQNIVCENEESAKLAINLLKSNKAGRTTFLPLNKIKPKRKREEDINEEGVIGFAHKLVSYEEKYEDVIYNLLGNCIITDNIDTAIRIGKRLNGYKIVSLQGDVIFPGGAMSGGYKKSALSNIFGRKKEIELLNDEIKEIEATLLEQDEAQKNKSNLVAKCSLQIEEKGQRLLQMREEEKKLSLDIAYNENTMQSIEREMERQRQRHMTIEEDRQRAQRNIDENAEDIFRMQDEQNRMEDYIAQRRNLAKSMGDELVVMEENIVELKVRNAQRNREIQNKCEIAQMIKRRIESLEDEISVKEEQYENLHGDMQAIQKGIDMRSENLTGETVKRDLLLNKKSELAGDISHMERDYETVSREREEHMKSLSMLQNQKYEIDIKIAKVEAQDRSLKEKLWDEFEMSYAEAMAMPKPDMTIGSAVRENRDIKNKLKNLGDINVGSIKEYEEVNTRYEFLTAQRADIQEAVDQLTNIIKDMDKIIKKKFKDSFDSIADNFEEIFKEFFGGGVGKIEIDNMEDPLNATIEITAQPPGKQLKNINLLSGGEKTMTAIALMFAVLKTKPTPCCILDEVEAALDDNNIHIFANYLKKFRDIQFTLITHQKTTMEHADVMYGVTMPERGISKIYSLKMGEAL